MIIFDKKKAIQTLMAKRNPKTGEHMSAEMKPQHVSHESGEPDGRHAAMQDFLMGVHEKDPHKMMESMANFHDLHAAQRAAEMAKPVTEEE